jgi:hypothetical protein
VPRTKKGTSPTYLQHSSGQARVVVRDQGAIRPAGEGVREESARPGPARPLRAAGCSTISRAAFDVTERQGRHSSKGQPDGQRMSYPFLVPWFVHGEDWSDVRVDSSSCGILGRCFPRRPIEFGCHTYVVGGLAGDRFCPVLVPDGADGVQQSPTQASQQSSGISCAFDFWVPIYTP